MQPASCLAAQPPLASGGCRHLRCFSAGGVTIGLIICGFCLFIFPPCYVTLCASKARHRLGSENVFWCLETSLFLRPFPGRNSVPPSFVSFFVLYIFSYLLSKITGCFSGCLMSSASIQKLFCGIYWHLNVLLMNLWGRKCSPRPIPLPSSIFSF